MSYTIIGHQRLESTATTITFSNIPANFTDLMLRTSLRGSVTATSVDINIRLNDDGEFQDSIILSGNGSAASSAVTSRTSGRGIPGSTATANTFGNTEFYIPNYRSSRAKSISINSVSENNATANLMGISAAVFDDTFTNVNPILSC
jgi:hypothetical protein